MKKFEKETKNVKRKLKRIGDTIEKAKNTLEIKRSESRKLKEEYANKTKDIKKLRE